MIDLHTHTTASDGRLNPELNEDPKGRPDCYVWSGDVAVRGRVVVDAASYEVLRVEQRYSGPIDVIVSKKVQRNHNFANSA